MQLMPAFGERLEIVEQRLPPELESFFWLNEHVCWMDRRKHVGGDFGFEPLAALLRKLEIASQDPLRSRCSKAPNDGWADDIQLGSQPRPARLDLALFWRPVLLPLPYERPRAMLDDVRDVDLVTRNTDMIEQFIE